MRKELFIDDRFIAEMKGLTRRFQQAEPHPANPVIHADRPWEGDAAFVDTGLVIFDEGEGLFRAWYQGGACYGPDDRSCMCYALSEDGVHWEKPVLGQVEFEGGSDNNIALLADCMMHDPAVIIDHKETDPERRYKAVWWGGRRDPGQPDGWLLGHCVGFSPDGVRWTEHPGNPVWPGDAEVGTPFDISRRSGRVVMYSSADGHGMRVVGRTESDDFVDWDLPPDLVFGYDEEDEPGTEFGGLAAIDYCGTQIGMLWVIRNRPGFSRAAWKEIVDRNIRQGFLGPPIEMNAAVCRTIHTELAVSGDGHGWQRVDRGAPLIPPGAAGTWDECLSLAGRPFVHDDRIWIYYTGCGRNSPTPGATAPEQIGNWSVDTGLATLRLDGFASPARGGHRRAADQAVRTARQQTGGERRRGIRRNTGSPAGCRRRDRPGVWTGRGAGDLRRPPAGAGGVAEQGGRGGIARTDGTAANPPEERRPVFDFDRGLAPARRGKGISHDGQER